MKAVLRTPRGAAPEEVAAPRVEDPDDVVIEMTLAGICRTDLAAAEGRLPCADRRILGHEFTGVVREIGHGVSRCVPGQRVGVFPILGGPGHGTTSEMLGVHRDGAFAERVRVPGRLVFPIPDLIQDPAAAMLEPVAACMAVLGAGLVPGRSGALMGTNRIARLTHRILESRGHRDLRLWDPDHGPDPEPESLDFVVETALSAENLVRIARVLRPGGRLVIKSRCHGAIAFEPAMFLEKELTIQFANYGSFEDAIAWVSEDPDRLHDLVGPVFPLDEAGLAFETARASEARKVFLTT